MVNQKTRKIKPKPKAYRVENVFALHYLEQRYKKDIMDIPAIYVFVNGKMYQYELEEENEVIEKFHCKIHDIGKDNNDDNKNNGAV